MDSILTHFLFPFVPFSHFYFAPFFNTTIDITRSAVHFLPLEVGIEFPSYHELFIAVATIFHVKR